MRSEEAKRQFHALKSGLESEAISQEEFDVEIGRFLFQDERGQYWTIGAETEGWYRFQDGEWLPGSPPVALERVERDVQRPQEAPQGQQAVSRPGLPKVVLIGLASLLLVACLAMVAVASYQYGRMSATMPESTPSWGASTEESSSASVQPSFSPTSTEEGTPAGVVTAPAPTATVEWSTPTAMPRPSSTPTIAGSPSSTISYLAPKLLGPADGSQFGPGYDAVLRWKLVDELGAEQYYHVEVCWNGCDGPDEFHGHYLRGTSYLFPARIYRGRAIDDRYYWHVVVRAQRGEQPVVPGDPIISEPSETWSFLLTD